MNGNGHTIYATHSPPQGLNQFPKFVGYTEANRIRDVEGGSTRLDHCLQDFTQKVDVGAAGVFGRKLDIFTKRPGQFDAVAGLFHTLPA